jgi:hypothetical protein
VKVTELNRQVILEWSNTPTSNNYLDSYHAIDPFADLSDNDYIFEGYRVIEYAEASAQEGKTIATFDVPNGIQTVVDGFPGQPTAVTLEGKDLGVKSVHIIGGLTNYKTYYYGVQAFAYNELSYPKVFSSPVVRVEATPRIAEGVISEAARTVSTSATTADFFTGCETDLGYDCNVTHTGIGQGVVTVDIVNPAVVIENATYTVEFYTTEYNGSKTSPFEPTSPLNEEDADGYAGPVEKFAAATGTTYDIKRDGTVVFSGQLASGLAPQRPNVITIDGLAFSVTGPEPEFLDFAVVQNASGPMYSTGAACYQGFPCIPDPDGFEGPGYGDVQQVQGGNWGLGTRNGNGGGDGSYANFIAAVIGWATSWDLVAPWDFEVRFTETTLNTDLVGAGTVYPVPHPFSLWNTGIGTPDDPSDDHRMLIRHLNDGGAPNVWDLVTNDHGSSSSDNDPYTDAFYFYEPMDTSPGTVGYDKWEALAMTSPDGGHNAELNTGRHMGRYNLWSWNGGDVSDYLDAGGGSIYDTAITTVAKPNGFALGPARPEDGTIFRIVTKKPNQPGDMFSFNTTGLGVQAPSAQLKKDRLAAIGVSPNPYKGASTYETCQLINEVRFTNLPSEETTIRIFTLNGALIRTIVKPAGALYQSWNMTTDNDLPIASGVYLMHIDVKDVGETVIKFAAVTKRINLDTW